MLVELSIRDILLVHKQDLAFDPGLNVLTGETGAGKSILLDCLGFVLGWRGRAEIVRQGADQGEVTAVFDLPADHPARAVLEDAGLPDDDQLILRRITTPDGRKRGFVNDRRASGDVLRQLSATLVELHGQQDDKGLLDQKGHRALLDAFAGHDALRQQVREAWRALSAAMRARAAAAEMLEKAARDTEFLRHAVAEFEELSPETGEDATLDARRRMLQMADKLRENTQKALQSMGSEGAEGHLADAQRWLETVADRMDGDQETLGLAVAALSRALIEVDEALSQTQDFARALDVDPYELERTEERLFAIRALARKHDTQPDELPALGEDLAARLAAIDGGDAELQRLAGEEDAARLSYEDAARRLTASRMKAARALDAAMRAELAPLKLEHADFSTTLKPAEAGPEGMDLVSFTVSTNPGAPAGPLARIASGGELSRFLLALKVCLTARADGLTMIFDEIDRGVGGATADAVGRRLADIATKAQVLVVTHSPQVAARGAHHFQVSKSVEKGQTRTSVTALDAAEREDEVARMLAGDTVTEEARSAARALISS